MSDPTEFLLALTEFLLAQIAEDEAAPDNAKEAPGPPS